MKRYCCNSTYCLRYWNGWLPSFAMYINLELQQYLPFTVLKLIWAARIPSDCLLLQQYLLFTVLKLLMLVFGYLISYKVATVLTVYGMRRRVRGSRGAKRRWGPHISSPRPKGRENKGDEVTVLTVYGIETLLPFLPPLYVLLLSCNSTYRLRYATKGARQQRSEATMRSAHLKYLNEVKVKQGW